MSRLTSPRDRDVISPSFASTSTCLPHNRTLRRSPTSNETSDIRRSLIEDNFSGHVMQRPIPQSLVYSKSNSSDLNHQEKLQKLRNLEFFAFSNKPKPEICPISEMNKTNSSECARKLVLCMLINAVFLFSIFLALLIGHWVSKSSLDQSYNTTNTDGVNFEANKPDNTSSFSQFNNSNIVSTLPNNSSIPNKSHNRLLYETNYFHPNGTKWNQNVVETIHDIYPPSLDDDSNLERKYSSYRSDNSSHHSPEYQSRNIIASLPKTILPLHYDIEMDFKKFQMEEEIHGNVSILFHSYGNGTEGEIIFHAASNIFIYRILLFKAQSGEAIRIRSVKRNLQQEFVIVKLFELLKINSEYRIRIDFRTRICQMEMEGAYCFRSTLAYEDSSSFVSRITGFVTKFEPRFARTFLPCWDEPYIKTTFNVSVIHFNNFSMVLSNMPVLKQYRLSSNSNVSLELVGMKLEPCQFLCKQENAIMKSQYELTPKMSIYLLAFSVGNFIPLKLITNTTNMPLTIWVEPENVIAVHFGANFSPIIFDKIQEDFKVKYPMRKLDFVVVPKFSVGGMENWGLIVFNAKYFLSTTAPNKDTGRPNKTKPKYSKMIVDRISEQYKIEKIITHEVVHQWFGNLVTMYNWDNLWLKEGFTTYFVYDLLNEAHPYLTEYEYYQNLIRLLHKQSSISPQALVDRHKFLQRSATELREIFDGSHLYTKGAVIVKMIKDLVGTFDFHSAITRYLKTYAFQSVDEESLWKCMPTYADHGAEQERLSDIFQSWLYNEGFPEVIISRNYEDQSIRITQQQANQNRYVVFLQSDTDEEADVTSRFRRRKRAAELGNAFDDCDQSIHSHRPQLNLIDIAETNSSIELTSKETLQHLINSYIMPNSTSWMLSTSTNLKQKSLPIKIFSDEKQTTKVSFNVQKDSEQKLNSSLYNNNDNSSSVIENAELNTSSTLEALLNETGLNDLDVNFLLSTSTAIVNVDKPNSTEVIKSPIIKSNKRQKQRGSQRNYNKHNSVKRIYYHSRRRNSTNYDNDQLPSIDMTVRYHNFQRTHRKRRPKPNTIVAQRQEENNFPSTRQFNNQRTTDSPVFSGSYRQQQDNKRFRPVEQLDQFDIKIQKQSSPGLRKRESIKNNHHKRGIWWIPFSYSFGFARSPLGQTMRQFWLHNQTTRFVDVGLTSNQFLLANPHWIYPYRVNYDIDNWRMIIDQLHLNHLDIPTMSRIQLLIDSDTYLKQSIVPHLYVYLLSYLKKETELGVLLVGLDAIHALVDTYSGTRIIGALIVELLPAIQQIDRQLYLTSTSSNPELAALWLLNPLRLSKLYQLRCLSNLGTCAENQQVAKWLAFPTSLDPEHHQQITAICHYLFVQSSPSEIGLLNGLLRQKSIQWSVLIQLAGCVRDENLIHAAVEQIIRTRNAGVYLSALKNGYSVQYNQKFRQVFWSGVVQLSLHERQLLFAVNTGKSNQLARHFIHASRTLDELSQIETLLPQWPEALNKHIEYVRRKLTWLHKRASDQIHSFLISQQQQTLVNNNNNNK